MHDARHPARPALPLWTPGRTGPAAGRITALLLRGAACLLLVLAFLWLMPD